MNEVLINVREFASSDAIAFECRLLNLKNQLLTFQKISSDVLVKIKCETLITRLIDAINMTSQLGKESFDFIRLVR